MTNVYIAFVHGDFRQAGPEYKAGTIACACKCADDEGNMVFDYYQDAGPQGDQFPGTFVVECVEAIRSKLPEVANEAIHFHVYNDPHGHGKYVINMTTQYIGDFLLSGGMTRNGDPVQHWDKWKRIAEWGMSLNPEPTWNYAGNDPAVNLVVNAAKKLIQ